MDPYREYSVPRQKGVLASRRRQAPVSRQVQDWTRSIQPRSGSRRSVIDRKASMLPAFSREGIRWDALIIVLSLLLLVFAGILFSDLDAICSGGDRIGKLSAGIVSLEGSNAMLQEELSLAMRHPVLARMNEQAEVIEETVVTITAASQP